jgi:hypothetical protein
MSGGATLIDAGAGSCATSPEEDSTETAANAAKDDHLIMKITHKRKLLTVIMVRLKAKEIPSKKDCLWITELLERRLPSSEIPVATFQDALTFSLLEEPALGQGPQRPLQA